MGAATGEGTVAVDKVKVEVEEKFSGLEVGQVEEEAG